jgi:hypothetical protein
MFSFMGFIEAASLQKDIKNKQVVPPALFCGVIGVSGIVNVLFGSNSFW